MTRQDRHDANDWAERAREMGYTRVDFDTSGDDDDPELGDFLLIYGPDAMWHSWGVGRRNGKFVVWRAADGHKVTIEGTIRTALAAIPPVVQRNLSA